MQTSTSTIVVRVSDAQVSRDPEVVLATYSLGPCIGVAVYDPVRRIGGLLHYQLPSSTADPQRAGTQPCMFADTGMETLLQQMIALGAEKKRLKVKIAGGAQMLNDGGFFNIGRRNHAAIRKLLWQHGILLETEHIGGSIPRNVYLTVADGSVVIKADGCSVNI